MDAVRTHVNANIDTLSADNVGFGVTVVDVVSEAGGLAVHALINLSSRHDAVIVVDVDVDVSHLFTGLSNVGPEPLTW